MLCCTSDLKAGKPMSDFNTLEKAAASLEDLTIEQFSSIDKNSDDQTILQLISPKFLNFYEDINAMHIQINELIKKALMHEEYEKAKKEQRKPKTVVIGADDPKRVWSEEKMKLLGEESFEQFKLISAQLRNFGQKGLVLLKLIQENLNYFFSDELYGKQFNDQTGVVGLLMQKLSPYLQTITAFTSNVETAVGDTIQKDSKLLPEIANLLKEKNPTTSIIENKIKEYLNSYYAFKENEKIDDFSFLNLQNLIAEALKQKALNPNLINQLVLLNKSTNSKFINAFVSANQKIQCETIAREIKAEGTKLDDEYKKANRTSGASPEALFAWQAARQFRETSDSHFRKNYAQQQQHQTKFKQELSSTLTQVKNSNLGQIGKGSFRQKVIDWINKISKLFTESQWIRNTTSKVVENCSEALELNPKVTAPIFAAA